MAKRSAQGWARSMAYSYKFSSRAETELDSHLDYIANELHNPTAAQNFFRKIFEAIDNVCNFPQSGTLIDNDFVSDASIRRLLVDNYIVYYKPLDAERAIYIVRIVYGYRKQEDI